MPIKNPLMCALGRKRGTGEKAVIGPDTRSGQEAGHSGIAAPICDRQGRVIGRRHRFNDVTTRSGGLKRAVSYQGQHDCVDRPHQSPLSHNRLHALCSARQSGEGLLRVLYIRTWINQGWSTTRVWPPGWGTGCCVT